ncbi:flagellar assembly protein FliW [Paenibacillus silviterrae]|uniref:flagellar assembly protein FliW n=1 Tax=Paenibacillus silviterrae TaxID=3242194 RepID=UPI002543D70C|nr:flagellar assembly protein FliW [Paenibacillus chinjuensis]
MITINTSSLGEMTITEEQIINFPEGIPGFVELHRFTLLPIDPELPFAYLQSVDEEMIHFIVVNPFHIYPLYDIHLDHEIQEELEIEAPEDVEVWSILTIRDSFDTATVNLMAPVIINSKKRSGKQIVLHQSNYTTRHMLSDLIHSTNTETKG